MLAVLWGRVTILTLPKKKQKQLRTLFKFMCQELVVGWDKDPGLSGSGFHAPSHTQAVPKTGGWGWVSPRELRMSEVQMVDLNPQESCTGILQSGNWEQVEGAGSGHMCVSHACVCITCMHVCGTEGMHMHTACECVARACAYSAHEDVRETNTLNLTMA